MPEPEYLPEFSSVENETYANIITHAFNQAEIEEFDWLAEYLLEEAGDDND